MKYNLILMLVMPVICNPLKRGDCIESITRVSGSQAPWPFCKNDLIFNEDFETLNTSIWSNLNNVSTYTFFNLLINIYSTCFLVLGFSDIYGRFG